MANIAAAPFVLKNVTCGIGTDTYEAALRTIRFDPTTPVIKWRGLTPTSRFRFFGDPEWTATITFAQDIASAASLSKRLHSATPGESVVMTFDPIAGGATVTATILLVPASIGGDIDTVPEASVTFEVAGQPVIGA
ncbi:hypothetical protein MRBLWO14_001167 [Microbacterium sp. LWO14-1.2]|uniref:hypothetical protein n=1 Tax=Microbacterium sp. LWO14-1.2 TaxID=3135263 RepID=UPI00313A2FBE